MTPDFPPAQVCVVGAGAAGLMAAIWARRTAPEQRVLLLDGARRLGAKILISGGGRCNVTHERAGEKDFAGSSPMAIRKVLRRFDVPATIAFFGEIGVELKREDTGKLFPTSDRARTVLDALLQEAKRCGVDIAHPCRVETVVSLDGTRRDAVAPERNPQVETHRGADRELRPCFRVAGPWGSVDATRVVLATGGQSVPSTGSDGAGYGFVRALGHSVTQLLPALVPLTLPRDHFLTALRGIAVPVELELRSTNGKRVRSVTGPLLCTHTGVSGPVVLDISRHYLEALRQDVGVSVHINWLPGRSREEIDNDLLGLEASTPGVCLSRNLPERLARALCDAAGLPAGVRGSNLLREHRRTLLDSLVALRLPITGSRGFAVAEATAGGVPLAELRLETMASRLQRGLHICGEICDVDGRIGGFNFQWAWSSGYVAGVGAASGQRQA